MDLALDNLKLEADLEKTINSDLEIISKTQLIKSLLSRMVAIDASIIKFNSMITPNNNNELNQQNNGNN